MRVRDLPPGRLLTVEPQSRLADVARRMRVADADSVAVMSEGRLVGIITERDLVRAIADGVNPDEVAAEVVMSERPATVREDDDVAMVAVKMMTLGIRHLPVVNQEGVPVGLISARDLIPVLERGKA